MDSSYAAENPTSCWYPFQEEHEQKVTMDLSRYEIDDTNSVRKEAAGHGVNSQGSPTPGRVPASSDDDDSKSIESAELPVPTGILNINTNCFSGEFWTEEINREECGCADTTNVSKQVVLSQIEEPSLLDSDTLPPTKLEASYDIDRNNSIIEVQSRRKSLIRRALCKRPEPRTYISKELTQNPTVKEPLKITPINDANTTEPSSSLARRAMCIRQGRSRSLPRARRNVFRGKSREKRRLCSKPSSQQQFLDYRKRDGIDEFIEVVATTEQLAQIRDIHGFPFVPYDYARNPSLIDDASGFFKSALPCQELDIAQQVNCTQMWHGGAILMDLAANECLEPEQSQIKNEVTTDKPKDATKKKMSEKVSRRARANEHSSRLDRDDSSNESSEKNMPRGRIRRSSSFHEVPSSKSSQRKKGRSRSMERSRSKSLSRRSRSAGRRKAYAAASSQMIEERETAAKTYDESARKLFEQEKAEWERQQAQWDDFKISGIRKVSSRLSEGTYQAKSPKRNLKSRTFDENDVISSPPRKTMEKRKTSKALKNFYSLDDEINDKQIAVKKSDIPWLNDDVSGLNTAAFNEFQGDDEDSIFNDLKTETGSKFSEYSRNDKASRFSSRYSTVSRTSALTDDPSLDFVGCFT